MNKSIKPDATTLSQIAGDLIIANKELACQNDIKKIRGLKMKTRVCILTNYPYPQYKKKCFEAGADYFLSKTEDFEDIKIVIADIYGETITPDGIQ